jgi:triacylglycerol lipase
LRAGGTPGAVSDARHAEMPSAEHVLLVHGLAETAAWMRPLSAALRLDGFRTYAMDYPSTTATIQELTDNYLHHEIEKLATAPTLHIVTHSMAAVMLRYYLQTRSIPNLGRIVMIAPGHAGSRMLTYLNRIPLYPAVMGPASLQSADDEKCFACTLPDALDQDYGIIAGCVPLDPLAWFVIQEPNDGRVTVESTRLGGMRDHLVLPTSHDMILFDPIAITQTREFLRRGKFFRSAPGLLPPSSREPRQRRSVAGRLSNFNPPKGALTH